MLVALASELDRSYRSLHALPNSPPYFISYWASDVSQVSIVAARGALIRRHDTRDTALDVEVRVGTRQLDSSHEDSEDDFAWFRDSDSVPLPLDGDARAIADTAWRATDRAYWSAVERLSRVKGNKAVRAESEDPSPDFSEEQPIKHYESPAVLEVDAPTWEQRMLKVSALFKEHDDVLDSSVQFRASATTRYIVSSEGTEVQSARIHARIDVSAEATTDDGMDIERHESIDAPSANQLPGEDELRAVAKRVIEDVEALRRAPVADPYAGPAILDGEAAAVFFHEIFGHRVEGHRQKDEEEGQTFAKKVGESVMPGFMNVFDDPSVVSAAALPLNGHYLHDDEGTPARDAKLVEGGVLRGFLMSRAPVRGFLHSNGHGRKQPGYTPVARQGNLIVDPQHTVAPAVLKQMLLDEIRKQKKPYGLRFSKVVGGFTMTDRSDPQAFKVEPVVVYRVFPDGREELVRGVDFEGTPLVVLSRILAASDDYQVFNGYCGAESGWVPVSATSPSLLLQQIEVTRKEKSRERPPILPPPARTGSGGAS